MRVVEVPPRTAGGTRLSRFQAQLWARPWFRNYWLLWMWVVWTGALCVVHYVVWRISGTKNGYELAFTVPALLLVAGRFFGFIKPRAVPEEERP